MIYLFIVLKATRYIFLLHLYFIYNYILNNKRIIWEIENYIKKRIIQHMIRNLNFICLIMSELNYYFIMYHIKYNKNSEM